MSVFETVPNKIKILEYYYQDYQILQLPDLNHQISVNQIIFKVLNSQTEFTKAICFSNATVVSTNKISLYNQLKQNIKISNIDINNDYYHYNENQFISTW